MKARKKTQLASIAALALAVAFLPAPLIAGKKKEQPKEEKKVNILDALDYSKIVWPNPPAITRVKYLNYFSGQKYEATKSQKKASWMDRLSGVATGERPGDTKLRFQLLAPYGVGTDSKGQVYIADAKVGAVFIVNPETNAFQMIKNGYEARFNLITGLTLDDGDTLFVSDSVAKHVLVFNPKTHKPEAAITEGMASPAGLAVDNENRFLYVCDTTLDQVLVYDADPPYKLIRKMGHTSKNHELTAPGDFSRPTNAAVDDDGNLYVSDTFNDRVEVFDADGNFIRTWGKAGDGPAYFARPKGIAIDSDGHVWVVDSVQDRVKIFTPEGRLLMWMGGHGLLPGMFSSIQGITIDRTNHRVFTTEQYPGRMQMFRFFTDEEAKAELEKREAAAAKKTPVTSKVPAEAKAAEGNSAAQQ